MTTLFGIDPGLASTGYGVIRFDGTRFTHVVHGLVTTEANTPLPERLCRIYREIRSLLAEFLPDEAAVEELYFTRNYSTGMQVAHARGVVLMALGETGIPVGFYSPQQVKQAVIGAGRAEKSQVQQLVKVLLGLDACPSSDHAADALAVAICHANRVGAHVQQHIG
jgi:crossover junction endodeoxyribonuclease RuvC